MSTPSAGWYPDPKMPGTQRYWDGEGWSDHVAPGQQQAPPKDQQGLLALSYLMMVMFPIGGFIAAFFLDGRRYGGHQAAIMVGSVLFGLFWFIAGPDVLF